MAKNIVFIDIEVSETSRKVFDYGAAKSKNDYLHTASETEFSGYVSGIEFVCGHNIIEHDLKYCSKLIKTRNYIAIDTLYMSPLLFPKKPYHCLVKDDKLIVEQANNPANDSVKAMELFYDEVNTYNGLPAAVKHIYSGLLKKEIHFEGFFEFVNVPFSFSNTENEIRKHFAGKICQNADISNLIKQYPVELAYALAIISVSDNYSIIPPWVAINYPQISNVIHALRETACEAGCDYCRRKLDIRKRLNDFFGFKEFRTYNGEPLQEKAAQAAVDGRSLLAVFPTGGGKSITFQLPALIAGETSRGLTVIISPLQSLMKDQVDNLSDRGIVDAVTINGMLNPIERAEAIERVSNGMASMLYISPESLRSWTIEKLLLSRNVVRFVIDEAHCFSAWGQDFRVDYLYIGDFIRNYIKQKNSIKTIPVSCFTATAKQKVISDICDYFRQKLNIELELYTTNAARENLRFVVLHKDSEEEKYTALRALIEQKKCPTIVYVSRTGKTFELANKLSDDGYPAKPFNGKMEREEKIANQDAFINNSVQIIVATSAFGMGVDKKDVGMVIHYEISDSLENYVQEAGRAGRDRNLQAECYVLFNDDDLNKHFMLLNQTKLSISEIQQIWKAIKELTKTRPYICRSPLEIARQAGWDDSVADIDTRVKTALQALENAGFIERGKNVPKIYANSILAHNMEEASNVIEKSALFNEKQKTDAKRIMSHLLSAKNTAKAGNREAESRIDYIADILGIEKDAVVESVTKMREEGLLADAMDMAAHIKKVESQNKSRQILSQFCDLETFLASNLSGEMQSLNYKEINDNALKNNIKGASLKNIKTILYYWTIKGFIQKNINSDNVRTIIFPNFDKDQIERRIERRRTIADSIIQYLYNKCDGRPVNSKDELTVQFSLLEVKDNFNSALSLLEDSRECSNKEIEDALLYLSKISAMNIEGGFLVFYSGLSINRLVLDNKIRYKVDDYKQLNDFYQNRIQQIHIVGEYANMMVKNYDDAIQFVNDYFQIDYKQFIAKYFKGTRSGEINRNITPEKYKQLFDGLSKKQEEIIRDDTSRYIVVIAGPGSGKTMVLVHKLASLLLLEDVKSDQLLMLTFSRAAATEFKSRLIKLIGSVAQYVDIKTFHSYSFDLLGKVGNLTESDDIVRTAADMIANGEVEIGRITKTVLVIDEAQDMDKDEFDLVCAIIARNEEMRVIAVGDDDQNIFEFRGSDSGHMKSLITNFDAKIFEMNDNYRSDEQIVRFTNAFAKMIQNRMKSLPIQSVKAEEGTVSLVKHINTNLETAVVEDLQRNYHGEHACILTTTNDEALRVTGLLTENGIQAKLIQSNDGFNLFNLAEIRFFMKMIDSEQGTPVISNDIWERAIIALKQRYSKSVCLPSVLKLLVKFAEINKTKYRSDLAEFVCESKLEDFYDIEDSVIVVSTIHKAKGREFDSVYMLLANNVNYYNEAAKRAIYVGMTRAKKKLVIHYTHNFLDRFKLTGAGYMFDDSEYPEPDRITLQFNYKDVFLDFVKEKKEDILKLQSGAELTYRNGCFFADVKGKTVPVTKLSKRAIETVIRLNQNGYEISSANVRFIVAWKPENEETEYAVILPDVHLMKSNNKVLQV